MWRIEHARLRLLTPDRALGARSLIITILFTGLIAAGFTGFARHARAILTLPALLLLLTIGHDDAIVMFGVLQISFSQNTIAGRLRVAR